MNGGMSDAKGNALDAMKAAVPEAAEILRLLAHPIRLLLLCEIAREECSVATLERTLGLRQPGLSQQLAELRQNGLVRTRRQARSVFYSIADPRIKTLLDCLYAVFCGGPAASSTGADIPAPTPAPTPAVRPQVPATPADSARFARVERQG